MALNKPNTQAAAQFETFEDTDVVATEAVAAASSNEGDGYAATAATRNEGDGIAAPAHAAALAVQVQKPSALAIAQPKGQLGAMLASCNLFENELRNAMPVTWEDFNSINAANAGVFQVKTGAGDLVKLEEYLVVKLVSFQDQFVSAAKDTEAQGENLVKYSDDGVVLNDGSGMTVAEHQQYLKDQGEDATLTHRLVVVGELQEAGEKALELDIVGKLVQIVLSDTARRGFLSHGKQLAYQIANGRMSADDAVHVKFTVKSAGSGKKQFPLVTTNFADGKGPKR